MDYLLTVPNNAELNALFGSKIVEYNIDEVYHFGDKNPNKPPKKKQKKKKKAIEEPPVKKKRKKPRHARMV